MKRLPILLSVPHAGLEVPADLADRCLLTAEEVAADGDEGAAEIYRPLRDHVEAFHTTDVARAVVDMNRSEDDIRKDGVVKTHTCWEVPIWKTPLTESDVRRIIETYHRPYHARLAELASSGVHLGVDGHTMAAAGPPVGPDPGARRPLVCLSNADGTCPRATLEVLADCFRKTFGEDVSLNEPFTGGWIVRSHARELPWVQVELSRDPALSHDDKRRRVLEALADWCARTEPGGGSEQR